MTFVSRGNSFRDACDALGQLDAIVFRLLSFNDVVVFDGARHIGTSVSPRQKAVRRFGAETTAPIATRKHIIFGLPWK